MVYHGLLAFAFITGSWRERFAKQGTHEINAQVDEGKEDAEAVLQPGWFKQEVSSLYPA